MKDGLSKGSIENTNNYIKLALLPLEGGIAKFELLALI